MNLTGADQPDRLVGCFVTANTLRLLGAHAAMGRLFTDAETAEGSAERVAVLSHAVWTSRYGADSGILGRTIVLNGLPHVVIGMTAEDYQDPFGPPEVWVPVTSAPNANWLTRANPSFWAVGRLKRGVSHAQARPTSPPSPRRSRPSSRRATPGWTRPSSPLRDYLVGNVRPALLMLLGFVALILLIACANIANLHARAGHRRAGASCRFAPRSARGRGRLVRQLLTESVVLALIGGAVGRAGGALGHRRAGGGGAGRPPRVRRGRARLAGAAVLAGITVGAGLRVRRGAGALRHAGRPGRRLQSRAADGRRGAPVAASATRSSPSSSHSASCCWWARRC